jgi:hypothetical protein
MSSRAVTLRLKRVAQLRNLCLALAHAYPAKRAIAGSRQDRDSDQHLAGKPSMRRRDASE